MEKSSLLPLLAAALLFTPSGRVAAQNLLVNPGFEQGTQNDAPPWAVGGWRGSVRAVTTEVHSGRRSIMLEGGGDEGGINSVMQVIPIDPTGATKYKLSAWVKLTAPVSVEKPGRTRVRWYFNTGANGGENWPEVTTTDWVHVDSREAEIIPPAGATLLAFRMYVYSLGTHPGSPAAYIDDMEAVPSPTGTTYPGVKGTVKDKDGKPIAGAHVFLKNAPNAQEFGTSSAVTDSEGNYSVCTADDGASYVVAWKQGWGLSEEKAVTLAGGGPLTTFNPVLTKGAGGRNLAISTSGRTTKAVDTDVGRYDDPQFSPVENLFDGNTISTRYWNNVTPEPAGDRWAYIDLDPVGKAKFTINEFVLRGPGVTLMTEGADAPLPKDFAIEYTEKDPATENEAGWTSHVAYSVAEAIQVWGPVVIRLAAPITARAVRIHVTAGPFALVDFQVNSDKLPRGSIKGVVKDATTGAPVAGARVSLFFPNKIQSDPDIYGLGNAVPFVVRTEETFGSPYEYAQAKNTEQTVISDATGGYSFSVNPGLPVRVSAGIDGYPYLTASVTPPEDGSAATQDFSLGKGFLVSGVIKDANGPLYNAIVQIGGADSKTAVVTDADGKYSVIAAAGSQEIYADAAGHAGKLETVAISAALTKDITLDIQDEPGTLSSNFETVADWEIAHYDTDWKFLAKFDAVKSADQNSTPAGTSSALIVDATSRDGAVERTNAVYVVLQRKADKRVAVTAGKTYNVSLRTKAGNWVTTDHLDAAHYEVHWLDAAGALVGRIYSHPLWIYAQPFWRTYNLGHPAGSDGSVALVRLSPPAGAAWLDVKVGWLRNPSGATEEKPDATNPEGSQLFVDDLVIDSFGAALKPGPVELGQTVNGFQDEFTSAARDPNWKARGSGGDYYEQADGLLRVSPRAGDPNHLLYEAAGASNKVQEVLARIRVTNFGANDAARAGIGVGVSANTTSQGINFHFRDNTQDGVLGRQFKLLDDARAWGPPGLDTDWVNNTWYWMRLRQELNANGGTDDVFAKAWLADGTTPEPTDWQQKWNYIPTRTQRLGFAGITGSSIDGIGTFEVDYILIKADTLPQITVAFDPVGPPVTAPRITSLKAIAGNKLLLEWIGTGGLESASSPEGPYKAIAGGVSPWTITPSGVAKFYRLTR